MKTDLVVFFSKNRVEKEMLFREFDAALDGVVDVPEYASQEVRAAYVVYNASYKIETIVFFTINFLSDGRADPEWALPLKHLAKHGGSGPDLGAGPVALTCRSQCSLSWYQKVLWEPKDVGGTNPINELKYYVAAKANQKRSANIRVEGEEDDVPVLSSAAEPPVLAAQASAKKDSVASAAAKEKLREAVAKANALDKKVDALKKQLKTREEEQERLHRALALSETSQNQQIEQLQQKLRTLTQKNKQLGEQIQQQKEAVIAAEKNAEEQKSRIAILRSEYMEMMSAQKDDQGDERKLQDLQRKLAAAQDKLERQAEQQTLMQAAFEEQLAVAAQKDAQVDQLLQQMADKEMAVLTFEAGAGHIRIDVHDLPDYLANPMRYAAAACEVSEEQYRAWLKAYEQGGAVEHPSEFKMGSPG